MTKSLRAHHRKDFAAICWGYTQTSRRMLTNPNLANFVESQVTDPALRCPSLEMREWRMELCANLVSGVYFVACSAREPGSRQCFSC